MLPTDAPDPKDLRAIMQQNDALKTFVGILVSRLGGEVTLTAIDFTKSIMLTCETQPNGHVHMVAKRL